jgi:hypothetical protein
MDKKKEFVEFSIRVPVDLNEKIEADAELAERKKNQQVNFIIKEHYESQEEQLEKAQTGQ